MTFSEVYERILEYWPERIGIADGRPVPNGGWYSAALNGTFSEVESRIDHEKDTWGSLMAWTMFQAFHTEAEKLSEMGSVTLSTRTVDRKIIEEGYFENLHSPEWSEELAAYRRG